MVLTVQRDRPESICTDKRILEENVQMKLQGPDYKNMPPEEAMKDFLARTANYEKAYETICDVEEEQDDLAYVADFPRVKNGFCLPVSLDS